MKKAITTLALSILTAALLIFSTVVSFATPTDAPSISAPSTTSSVTPETNTPPTLVFNEQTPAIVPNNAPVPEISIDPVIKSDISNDPVIESDISNDAHEHNWKLLGHGELGFTVVCECGNQYSTPFEPCEHALVVVVDGIFPGFHSYECEKCCYYARMQHEFEYCCNEDMHYMACVDCGYVAEEAPHNFETIAFDRYYHTNKCVECGYVNSNDHCMIEDVKDNFTLIHCDSCEYVSEKRCNHNNVYMIGELNHVSRCLRCDEFVDEQHTFINGVCECGYEATQTTQYGIVTDFYRDYDEEGNKIYIAEMLIDHEYYEFSFSSNANYREVIEEGSFVEVVIYENELLNMILHIDYTVVDEYENFEKFVSHEVMEYYSFMDYVEFNDLIIDEVNYYDGGVDLEFDRLSASYYCDYVVYDLRDSEMGRLNEGDAIIQFQPDEIVYFVIIW